LGKTCWIALAFAATVQIASAAEITGKITLTGDPPAERATNLSGDLNCGPLWKDAKLMTRLYVVSPDKGLGDVEIYLKGVPPAKNPGAKPVELDQVKCMYTPYVVALQTARSSW
jgi:hypothetical protein